MLPLLTTYDQLGANSSSIDPLGALQTYSSLADLFLPGVTTITNRSRYLSMLCAAIANAEAHHRFLPGASGLAQRRKAIEPFERLWALACVAARNHGNNLAADGLRGITYAEKMYRHIAQKGRKVSPDFKLLKYQSRTGAVGTYWTALIGGELVHADSGSLTYEGAEIAKQFPEPRLTAKNLKRLAEPVVSNRVTMTFDDLVAWSDECHLVAAEKNEREQLGDALTADDRKDSVAQALRKIDETSGLPAGWNTRSLEHLRGELSNIGRAVALGIPTVVEAIIITEQFHEAVLTVLQVLLWWGTQHASMSLDSLFHEQYFQQVTNRCRDTALSLRQFCETCEQPEIRDVIEGFARFAYAIDHASSPSLVVDEIRYRHHQVQSGKVDGGVPKRDWFSLENGKVLRPSPRFQRNEPPPAAAGRILTHPYRLEPFIYMLRENDVLRRPKQEAN